MEDIKKWYETKKTLIKVTSNLDGMDGALEAMIKIYFHKRLWDDDGN